MKLYTLDEILEIHRENEMPGEVDLYGWNKFAIERKWFTSWYEWRKYQYDRMLLGNQMTFMRYEVQHNDILQWRIGTFPGLIKYYLEALQKDQKNFLYLPEARFEHIVKDASLLENKTFMAIKQNIQPVYHIIWFEKDGVVVIQDGNTRCIALAQLLTAWKSFTSTIYLYLHHIETDKRVPYIDFLPELDFHYLFVKKHQWLW